MKQLLIVAAALFVGGLQPAAPTKQEPAASALSLKRSIPLAGVSGRIDHLAFDPTTKRLFVAALENGSLEVIDLEKGERIKTVGGLKEPQGAAYVPGTKQVVVACGGDGTVHAYSAETLDEKTSVRVGDDADNVRLSADSKSVIVGYGGGALAVLDATTLRKTGEVKLAGHPESFQVETGSSRVFANVPATGGKRGAVVVVDLAMQKVTSAWELEEAERNYPMALDAPHKRLYIGCRRAAKLLVLDTESGRVVASPECVGDADDVFVDSASSRVFVIGGDGAVDVFETKDHQTYTRTESVKTGAGARTGLLVPERRALYVAVPKRGSQQAEVREYGLPN